VSNAPNWVDQFDVRQQNSRELWIEIKAEFDRQTPPMTVRQVFYRMSSIGAVEKTENGYRKVQHALTVMREKGAIPYWYLADNTRWVRKPNTYSSIGQMLNVQQKFYRRALWDTQLAYVEIYLEKDALAGVLYNVTEEYDVPLYVTRGYPSLSYLHLAAETLRAINKPIYLYHFGDYDASGKDAARSIRDGLHKFGAQFHFEECAVTRDQISQYKLQTRVAKQTDSRAKQWGTIAVELDAIEPSILRQLVRQCIERHVDHSELNRLRAIEAQEQATIGNLFNDFGTSTELANGGGA